MPELPDVQALVDLPDAACAALRARFLAAGFDERVHGVATDLDEVNREAIRFPLVHAALEGRTDAASRVALLFTFAGSIPEDDARAALGPSLFDALRGAGVVVAATEPGSVRSAFRITPIAGLWVLADPTGSGAETVMPPGATTSRMIDYMPARIDGAALDLGCGPGAFALVAAQRGASPSVGSDISERAIAMARFNARLNSVAAEFRVGSLAEPVASMRFALVVSQPPYVMQPDDGAAVTFMHGGRTGGELALRFAGAAASVLAPGGRALVQFDVAVREGESPASAVSEALGESPDLDALVLVEPGASFDQLAVSYASMEAPALGAAFARSVRRYHRHLAGLGVEGFHHVLVVLHRHDVDETAPGWTAAIPARALSGITAQTLDIAMACVKLASTDDATLASAALQPCPAVLWVDERPAPDPRMPPTRAYRFGEGTLGRDGSLDEQSFALLTFVSGAPSVGEGAAAFATALRADPDAVLVEALAFVRAQLVSGLLEPRES